MVEFDVILKDIGGLSKAQWIQILLLTLVGLIVAMHMGAMVFLGATQPHQCAMPYKSLLSEICEKNWTSEQTAKYIPWNVEKNSLDSCTRFIIPQKYMDCNYWWEANTTMGGSTWNATALSSFEECSSWEYDTSIFESTIVDNFDLICSEKYKRRFTQAIFMLGVMIGCVFWGHASDRFGRKIGIVGPALSGLIFGIATAFAGSFAVFTALRFFVGFCVFPAFSSSFVMGSECAPPKYRVWVGQTAQATFALGFCLLALIGYVIRDWKTLQLAISIPLVIIIFYYWLLFESPRWLISTKLYIQANKIVKRMLGDKKSAEAEILDDVAQRQRSYKMKSKEPISDSEKFLSDTNNNDDMKRSKKIYSVIDLVRGPNTRKKSLILFYNWMVASCVYYGLTMNAADLGGDPFLNLFISGLAEVPAAYLAVIILEKWGRRPTLTFALICGGICCMCMTLIPPDMTWLNILLSTLGKFNASAAFGAVYIYAAEIYPTPIRNLGMGVCSSWARIGGVFAPFIAMLDAVAGPLPYIVFGVMTIFGGFLALFLPEVKGAKLPETLEEGEEFGKNHRSIFSCCCGDQESANGMNGNYDIIRQNSNEEKIELETVI